MYKFDCMYYLTAVTNLHMHVGIYRSLTLGLQVYSNMVDSNQTDYNTTEGPGFPCALDVPDVLLIIIGSLAVLLNGLLLLLIVNNRGIFLRTRVSYLVANLSLADFLTGAILVLVVMRRLTQSKDNFEGFQFLFLCTSIHISFLTLLLMSFDRVLVAVLPLTWSGFLTGRRTIFAIAVVWALSIFGSIMIQYHTRKKRLAILLFQEISVCLFTASHVFIFQFLKRQRRWLVHSIRSAVELTAVVDLPLRASHAQITSVVLTLMLVLIVTYLPYIVRLNILMATKSTDIAVQQVDTVFRYTQAFSYLNFAVNPIIYAWRLKVYRRAFCKMFGLSVTRRRSQLQVGLTRDHRKVREGEMEDG